MLVERGQPQVNAIRAVGTTEQTEYRWWKAFGGAGTEQLRELKRWQKVDERLRRTVSDLALDKLILAVVANEYL